MSVVDPLLSRQLLVVTGKGGVGKTVVSATLGRELAARGRRTLIIEVDPRENLHRMLGLPPSGGDVVPAGAAGTRLWVQNLKPGQVLDTVVREQVRLGVVADRVLASALYQQFAAAAPGLKEMAILGHAYRLLNGLAGPDAPRLDVVVLDAPATGHGVSLLAAPQLVAGVIQRGPFGHLAGELARLIGDAGRSGIAVVTQAEEMPVEEALELAETLAARFGRGPELVVVNGLYPPAPVAAEGAEDDTLAALWRRRRALNERELARLRAGLAPGSTVLELPQPPLEAGPALLAALGDCLRAGGVGGVAGISSVSSAAPPGSAVTEPAWS